MGFLKELGSFVGETVKFVGELTGSEFIEEIGDRVKRASYFAGDKLGKAASGTWDIAVGIINQDETQPDEEINDMGKAIGDTAKAAGQAVCNVVENSIDVVGGIIDFIDGADGIDGTDMSSTDTGTISIESSVTSKDAQTITSDTDVGLVDNLNTHHVETHWRVLGYGTRIWVDGMLPIGILI